MKFYMAFVLLLISVLHIESAAAAAQLGSPNADFCALTGVTVDPEQEGLWSAETVAFQIDRLASDPLVQGTPWAAYPVAYRQMTAARDISRCSGQLKGVGLENIRINHLLSDIMSRWYVLSVEDCARADAQLGTKDGFCPLMRKMRDENYDTLSATIATTAVYISSHIALSLSAIIFADDFWMEFPNPELHNDDSRSMKDVIEARIAVMKNYKPLFDRFNQFLSVNLGTVTNALRQKQLVQGPLLGIATSLSSLLPFKDLVFGKVRDQAFNTSIEIARSVNPADHPMMRVVAGKASLNYGAFNFDYVYPKNLSKLESDAIGEFANVGLRNLYRSLLGGLSWEQLRGEKSKK